MGLSLYKLHLLSVAARPNDFPWRAGCLFSRLPLHHLVTSSQTGEILLSLVCGVKCFQGFLCNFAPAFPSGQLFKVSCSSFSFSNNVAKKDKKNVWWAEKVKQAEHCPKRTHLMILSVKATLPKPEFPLFSPRNVWQQWAGKENRHTVVPLQNKLGCHPMYSCLCQQHPRAVESLLLSKGPRYQVFCTWNKKQLNIWKIIYCSFLSIDVQI